MNGILGIRVPTLTYSRPNSCWGKGRLKYEHRQSQPYCERVTLSSNEVSWPKTAMERPHPTQNRKIGRRKFTHLTPCKWFREKNLQLLYWASTYFWNRNREGPMTRLFRARFGMMDCRTIWGVIVDCPFWYNPQSVHCRHSWWMSGSPKSITAGSIDRLSVWFEVLLHKHIHNLFEQRF